MTLYEAKETDAKGQDVYFFWHWSQSEGTSAWWHAKGATTFMRNRLDVKDSDRNVTHWQSSSAHDVNGKYVKTGAIVGVDDIEAGLVGETWVNQSEIGPETAQLTGVQPENTPLPTRAVARKVVM